MKFFCGAMFIMAAQIACQNESKPLEVSDDWSNYHVGYIAFQDKAPESRGSAIYHQIITNPEAYITAQAKDVLSTLYFSPADSIVPLQASYQQNSRSRELPMDNADSYGRNAGQ